MLSGILHRTLQCPTAVSAASLIKRKNGYLVVLLQDTSLTFWRTSSDGLEPAAAWRAPASLLQMMHLPSGHLLVIGQGGRVFLYGWEDDSVPLMTPVLISSINMEVPVDMTVSLTQDSGCVMSSNVLSSHWGPKVSSLAAVCWLTGVLHIIKAAPLTPKKRRIRLLPHYTPPEGSSEPTNTGWGSMELEAKTCPLTLGVLRCHYPGT